MDKRKNALLSKITAAEVTADSSESDDCIDQVSNSTQHSVSEFTGNVTSGNDTDHSVSSSEDCWDYVNFECDRVSTDDSTGSDIDDTAESLKSDLQAWAVDCSVTHQQLNKLLPILGKYVNGLPLTVKTFLCTSKDMQCISLSGGDCMHFGVEAGLSSVLRDKANLLSGITAV